MGKMIVTLKNNETGEEVIKELQMPQEAMRICENALSENKFVQKVVIPSGITSIGNCAFGYCTSLEEISIPEGVKSIGDSAFEGCTSLKLVNANGIKSIGDSAFKGCIALKYVSPLLKLKSMGNRAFEGCKSLEEVVIKNEEELDKMGIYVFDNYSSLKEASPFYIIPDDEWCDEDLQKYIIKGLCECHRCQDWDQKYVFRFDNGYGVVLLKSIYYDYDEERFENWDISICKFNTDGSYIMCKDLHDSDNNNKSNKFDKFFSTINGYDEDGRFIRSVEDDVMKFLHKIQELKK